MQDSGILSMNSLLYLKYSLSYRMTERTKKPNSQRLSLLKLIVKTSKPHLTRVLGTFKYSENGKLQAQETKTESSLLPMVPQGYADITFPVSRLLVRAVN